MARTQAPAPYRELVHTPAELAAEYVIWAQDRRYVQLERLGPRHTGATPPGSTAVLDPLQKIWSVQQEQLEHVMSGLENQEREELTRLLSKMIAEHEGDHVQEAEFHTQTD